MKRLAAATWFTLLCAFSPCALRAEGPATASPSPASGIDLSRIEISLVPDRNPIMLGERINVAVVVKNKTDDDLTVEKALDIEHPDDLDVTVTDENGTALPEPKPTGRFALNPRAQTLSASSSSAFKIFLPYRVNFEKPGRYTISVKAHLTFRRSLIRNGKSTSNDSASEPVSLTTTLDVVAKDDAKLGKVIADLGRDLAGAQGNVRAVRETLNSLLEIHDARVVPYLITALHSPNSTIKRLAIDGLADYNTDEALDALKQAAATTADNLEAMTSDDYKDQVVADMRRAAVVSLSINTHPDALPFLLTLKSDPHVSVRAQVLEIVASGKVDKATAIPIVTEMTSDSDDRIRARATTILDQLTFQRPPRRSRE